VFKPEVIQKFEDAWGAKLSGKVGTTIGEMFEGIEKDEIKFLYIMGENPVVSDPDTNHVKKVLSHANFIVVQDIFMNETTEFADVILPAAAFAEKDGTFSNTERRVQRVRKAINPPGESKADWEILMNIMNKMGYKNKYNHPGEIMDEIAKLTPSYGGISYERLESESLQWPCLDENHPGTKYLHKNALARGRGLFMPADYVMSAEMPDEEFPLIMTTGRILYHYHTRTMTGKEDGLNQLAPKSYVEINPYTANRLSIQDGEMVRLVSRRGEIQTSARITEIIDDGVVFMPFHFAEGAANYLTNTVTDKIAQIPELKVSAIRIEKL
ncbi:MAG: molybdopterin-dependent oxidoreductase, partial [Clostridia bacterium]|nr:molybdopterin-dependent oxidoreductase [Clostridia bacterium]